MISQLFYLWLFLIQSQLSYFVYFETELLVGIIGRESWIYNDSIIFTVTESKYWHRPDDSS